MNWDSSSSCLPQKVFCLWKKKHYFYQIQVDKFQVPKSSPFKTHAFETTCLLSCYTSRIVTEEKFYDFMYIMEVKIWSTNKDERLCSIYVLLLLCPYSFKFFMQNRLLQFAPPLRKIWFYAVFIWFIVSTLIVVTIKCNHINF